MNRPCNSSSPRRRIFSLFFFDFKQTTWNSNCFGTNNTIVHIIECQVSCVITSLHVHNMTLVKEIIEYGCNWTFNVSWQPFPLFSITAWNCFAHSYSSLRTTNPVLESYTKRIRLAVFATFCCECEVDVLTLLLASLIFLFIVNIVLNHNYFRMSSKNIMCNITNPKF